MFPMYPMFLFYPRLPNDCDLPPTIYSILDSIVNFGEEEETPIKNLAKEGRGEIFDFDYPLSTHINREDFEVMILNNYMMRRIGYETPTAFKLQLNVKLNSIMPIYNKLFDSLDGWNLFTDGEVVSREVTRGETSTDSSESSLTSSTTDDSRFSDTPQGRLQDIKDGTYMTDYTLNQNDNTSTGSSSGSSSKDGTEEETITRTPANKIELYKEFQNNIKSIYQLIFDELDELFYSLA